MKQHNLAYIKALIGEAESIETQLKPQSVFTKASLEKLKSELQAEHARETSLPERPFAQVYLNGAPVFGQQGIEASFAAEVISNFQSLVHTVEAPDDEENGDTPRDESPLSPIYLTDLPRSSFGFQFESFNLPEEKTARLRQAIEDSATLIHAAASSDEEFAETISERSPKVEQSLRDFFRTLSRNQAELKVVTANRREHFSPEQIVAASERTQIEQDSSIEVFAGTFLSIGPESRRFDFYRNDDRPIKGGVARKFSFDDLRQLNQTWVEKSCRIKVKKTVRGKTRSVKYTLLEVLEPDFRFQD